ncbi:MAG: Rpn family recombination-promoting nuclease/putative transposase [Dysgonamonadaceae bacterium]|jgi:predicted transposase/invertase (TIGR01784 family)|nr:Rpn family recombination-promoting nuclease/putative transposase [Dysgonamonadaceae bacterium]
MARYLDPRNDLTFKRIFGEHPRLLVSFLNALMPLAPDRFIESIEYLPPEQVPETPLKKNSIVDVRCIDNYKRQFIVEMQMLWSEFFNRRMVFNASKAYVRQLNKNEGYDLLHPVYGLGIINDVFDRKTPEYYHHYQTINRNNTEEVIEGLEFVLVELPKFKAQKPADRKMSVLWLRFLSEVGDPGQSVSPDLLENEEIHEALTLCEEGAFTAEEMAWYEQYWDYIRVEKGLADTAKAEGLAEGRVEGRVEGLAKGLAEGRAEGLAKGRVEGLAEGRVEGRVEGLAKGRAEGLEQTVLAAYENKFSIEQIRLFSGLDEDAIFEILKRNNCIKN